MSLLQNLCGPPRTHVTVKIAPFSASQAVGIRFALTTTLLNRLATHFKLPALTLDGVVAYAGLLTPPLEREWAQYQWHGVILLMAWHESTFADAQKNSSFTVHLSQNPLLVLNVLARARAGMLLPHLPLALEVPFLQRDWVATDPRLVKLLEKQK